MIPSLYDLFDQDLLPEKFAIIGASRSNLSDTDFRNSMKEGINKFSSSENKNKADTFLHSIFYQSVDAESVSSFTNLKDRLLLISEELEIKQNNIFYLSTPPSLYSTIPNNLAKVGLSNEKKGWKRIIIEKPFGYDLESAKELNSLLKKSWKEENLFVLIRRLFKAISPTQLIVVCCGIVSGF